MRVARLKIRCRLIDFIFLSHQGLWAATGRPVHVSSCTIEWLVSRTHSPSVIRNLPYTERENGWSGKEVIVNESDDSQIDFRKLNEYGCDERRGLRLRLKAGRRTAADCCASTSVRNSENFDHSFLILTTLIPLMSLAPVPCVRGVFRSHTVYTNINHTIKKDKNNRWIAVPMLRRDSTNTEVNKIPLHNANYLQRRWLDSSLFCHINSSDRRGVSGWIELAKNGWINELCIIRDPKGSRGWFT